MGWLQSYIWVCIGIVIIALFSCQPMMTLPKEKADNISFSVTSDFTVFDPDAVLEDMQRTITPGTYGTPVVSFAAHQLTIKNSGDGTVFGPKWVQVKDTVIVDADTTTEGTQSIVISGYDSAATYTATVTAYADALKTIQVAEGTASFTATSSAGPVSVVLKPIAPTLQSGTKKGYFSYAIKAPSGFAGAVSLNGPRLVSETPFSKSEKLSDSNAGYASISAGQQKTLSKLELTEGLYDFSLSLGGKEVLREVVYIYPGLETKYDKVWTTDEVSNGTKFYLTGTVSIANADNYDLGDISIMAFPSNQGMPLSVTNSSSAIGIAKATIAQGLSYNDIGTSPNVTGRAKFIGGYTGGAQPKADGDTVTVQWGMSVPTINGDELIFKVFSSATTAGKTNAAASDIFLASDTASADSLKKDVSQQRTGIIINDRSVGPPKLLNAAVYDNAPTELVLSFSQPVIMYDTEGWSLTGKTFTTIVEDTPGDDVDTSSTVLAVGEDDGYAYIWKMKFNTAMVKDAEISLGYTAGTQVTNSYGIALKNISKPFGNRVNSVGNPAAAPPKLVTSYVMPSSTDSRIGDELTLIFDQAVIMPNSVTADNLGFSLDSTAVDPDPSINNKSKTATVGSSRIIPNGAAFKQVEPYFYDKDGNKVPRDANGTTGSNIWVLPLNTSTPYANNFFINGDSATVSYEKPDVAAQQIVTVGVGGAVMEDSANPVTMVNNLQLGDWVAPQLYSAPGGVYVSNDARNKINLAFNEPVSITVSNNAAGNSGFSITEGVLSTSASTITKTGVASTSALWALTMTADWSATSGGSIGYSSGYTTVCDAAGNYLLHNKLDGTNATITIKNNIESTPNMLNAQVANDLSPAVMSAIRTAAGDSTINAHQVISVLFDQAVSIPNTAGARAAFVITGKTTSISKAVINGGSTHSTSWYLIMANAATTGESFTLKYNKPGSTDDQVKTASEITNAMENQAAIPVTNAVESDEVLPSIINANLNKKDANTALLTLVFSEPVVMSSWNANVFSIYADNQNSPIVTGGGSAGSTLNFTATPSSTEPVISVSLQCNFSLFSGSPDYTIRTLNLRYIPNGNDIKDTTGNSMATPSTAKPEPTSSALPAFLMNIQNFLNADTVQPNLLSATVEKKSVTDAAGVLSLIFDEPVNIAFSKTGSIYSLTGWTFKQSSTEYKFKNLDSDTTGTISDTGMSSVWTADIVSTAGDPYYPKYNTTGFSLTYTQQSPSIVTDTNGTRDQSGNELIAYDPGEIIVPNKIKKSIFINFPASSIQKGYSLGGIATGSVVDAGATISWTITRSSANFANGTSLSNGSATNKSSGSSTSLSVQGTNPNCTIFISAADTNNRITVTATADGISDTQTLSLEASIATNTSATDYTLGQLYAYEPITGMLNAAAAGITAAKDNTKITYNADIQNYTVLSNKNELWFAVSTASSPASLRVTENNYETKTSTVIGTATGGNLLFFGVAVPASGYKDIIFKVTAGSGAGDSKQYTVTIGPAVSTTATTITVTNNSSYSLASGSKMALIARNKAGYVIASGQASGNSPYTFNLNIPSGVYDYYATWTSGGSVYASRAAKAKDANDNNSTANDHITNFTYSSATNMSLWLSDDALGKCIYNPNDMMSLMKSAQANGSYALASSLNLDDIGPWLSKNYGDTGGWDSYFYGNLLGNRYTIKETFGSSRSEAEFRAGLFFFLQGDADGALVCDLNIIMNKYMNSNSPQMYGGLAYCIVSAAGNPVIVENINVSGLVDLRGAIQNAEARIGSIAAFTAAPDGLNTGAGTVGGSVTISGCSSSLVVNQSTTNQMTQHASIGGMIGHADRVTTLIKNCYWNGSINMVYPYNNSGKQMMVGGMVGWFYSGDLTINNCYSSGTISINVNTNTNSYTRIYVGGLLYNNNATAYINNSVVLSPVINATSVNTAAAIQINRITANTNKYSISNCYALPVGTDSDELNISYIDGVTTGTTSTAIANSASDANGATKALSAMDITWWKTTMGFTEENGWDYTNFTANDNRPVLRWAQ
jgi:hypothetical protein